MTAIVSDWAFVSACLGMLVKRAYPCVSLRVDVVSIVLRIAGTFAAWWSRTSQNDPTRDEDRVE